MLKELEASRTDEERRRYRDIELDPYDAAGSASIYLRPGVLAGEPRPRETQPHNFDQEQHSINQTTTTTR